MNAGGPHYAQAPAGKTGQAAELGVRPSSGVRRIALRDRAHVGRRRRLARILNPGRVLLANETPADPESERSARRRASRHKPVLACRCR
jgi:hypothetical protein